MFKNLEKKLEEIIKFQKVPYFEKSSSVWKKNIEFCLKFT